MIDSISEKISIYYEPWQIIRDVIAGSRTVKQKGPVYLPLAVPEQDEAAYKVYSDEVTFHPATARVVDGLCGLLSAKPATFDGPDYLKEIMSEIAYTGESFSDMVEWGNRETISVSYGGFLIDVPNGEIPTNQKDEIEQGFHPKVAAYAAETILDIKTSRIRNRDRVSYVKLSEDDGNQIRELSMVNGAYTVTIHRKSGDGEAWGVVETYTPLRLGEVINEIPFVPLTPKAGKFLPSKPLMEDVAELNLDHFRCEGRITYIHYWQSMAILWVAGADPAKPKPQPILKDANGDPLPNQPPPEMEPGYTVGGPEAWSLSDPKGKVDYAEFSGTGVMSLERKLKNIEDRIAKVGAQILAGEKVASEAAETVAMRMAAQHATLATTARTLSRCYTIALRWVVWWMGGTREEERATNYSLNTDYRVDTMTNEVLTNLRGMRQTRELSAETFFELLVSGGVLPESLTYEEEQKRRAQDTYDEPDGTLGLDDAGE